MRTSSEAGRVVETIRKVYDGYAEADRDEMTDSSAKVRYSVI